MATGSSPRSINASLYIDGRPAENTIRNLTTVTRGLNRDIQNLTIGSDEFNHTMEQLQVHERRLQAVRREVRGVQEGFGGLREEVEKYVGIAAGFLGFDFITDQFQNIIANNAKLSDSLADVRKTTGLSEAGVKRLYTELAKIDTRTSQEALVGLAEVAGKLGVSGEKNILGFVRAADKIKVALGGDLGDAEDAINSLGKLTDLFKVKDQFGLEDALIKTGSAINGLGAAGTASEAYIVQFTKRMGGIAPQANFSIESIMGLAATMDELGLGVEASSTAIGQFIVGMGKDIPGFARIAGMSVKDFSKTLKTDGNQALLEVLKNLQATGQGVEGLASKMGLVGEDGANAVAALGALSNNLDKLVTRQKMSKDLFAEGTSLQSEFDVKMQSLAATTELVTKEFTALGTNTVITDFLKNMVFSFAQFLKLIKENSATVVNLAKFLIVGTVAWGAYRVALMLATSATELYALRTTVARTVSVAFAGAQALLTGNLSRAAAAMRVLNITTAANPFAAVAAVVVALIAAVALFSKTTSDAQKAQEDFNAIDAESRKNQMAERDRIKALNDILISETASREKKLLALKKLREIMPAALQHLTDEEALTMKGTIAISKYIQALEKKSIAEAAQAQINKLRQRNIEIETGAENDTSLWQDTKAFIKSGTVESFQNNKKAAGRSNALDEKKVNESRIAAIQDRYKSELLDESGLISANTVTTGGKSTGGLTTTKKSKEQVAKEHALKEFAKLDDEYKKLNLQRLDDQLSANEKEVAQENNKYNALIKAEQEFLKFKGITAEQKQITEDKIAALGIEKKASETNIRIRQETEMLQSIANLQISLGNVHESELVKQRDQINKFYDEQEKKNVGFDKNIASLKLARAKALSDAEIREKERLEQEKQAIEAQYDTLSGNKKENNLAKINKKYDDELIALKLKFSAELQATKEFQDAKDALEKNKNAELKNQKLTDAQEARDFGIQMAQQASDATFTIISNNQKAQLQEKLSGIENERTKELSNKNLTEKQKEKINAKYDAKVKEEKLKGWKAEKAAAVAQAVVNGALAVTKVLAQTGVLSPFAIPAIVAGTAIQIGLIMAEPAPKFAQGGFSDEDPAGFVSKSTLFSNSSSGRPFEAGEAGKEWIAPNWMVTNPRYANMINMLEVARKEKRAYANGGFSNDQPVVNNVPIQDNSVMEQLLREMIKSQKEANSKPIKFIQQDYEDFLNERERVKLAQTG